MMAKRLFKDINDLKSKAKNMVIDDDNTVITFEITGPEESIYSEGKWKLRIELPKEYPYKSPSVGFITKIFHPNVDFLSGSICLNVLNQTWTPIYNLCHIHETFLPQLLLYPNPDDPLNTEAASMYLKDSEEFKEEVKEYIKTYCNK